VAGDLIASIEIEDTIARRMSSALAELDEVRGSIGEMTTRFCGGIRKVASLASRS
jgi:hypothetical protein